MQDSRMIALDVMGGDNAPMATLKGALATARYVNIPIKLFGPESQLRSILAELDPNYEDYSISFGHAPEVIGMDEDPVRAIRRKQDSSLIQAIMSVKTGECAGVVSAGSSGACMAAATLILGRTQGVRRPAIAGFMPAKKEPVLCLDLGANPDCKAAWLVEFAEMGISHLKTTRGLDQPRVGLLSNGAEASKGSVLVKKAHMLLSKERDINFIGNVEPMDVLNNVVDIVVCDGFVGNLFLKTAESIAELMIELFASGKNESQSSLAALEAIENRVDWKKAGGALLLGVCGSVVVAHGRANEEAIRHAIVLAHNAAQSTIESSLLSGAPRVQPQI